MHKVLLSAVRACLTHMLCAKPVGEAGGTEVLATAASEVRIVKDFGTDGADVLAGNDSHKLIIIITIGWLATVRKGHATFNQHLFYAKKYDLPSFLSPSLSLLPSPPPPPPLSLSLSLSLFLFLSLCFSLQ